ncbi:diguanylate cyclase [Fimbriimonas ginsengisoli]|uniref:Response regulator/GGDEF domain protein n=1 Tax=Fimbriimonas ginsengisoli Gsoil 348 TaxID=661478 RepID=A0A068NYL7_FIMGI|nr:diguanylate cyclase [Fimbriimonas ginsengisoli]AIE87044.1 response regulator/GGDEF domain protein [Fimbriimonas ginsengisoli Gsoil 348]
MHPSLALKTNDPAWTSRQSILFWATFGFGANLAMALLVQFGPFTRTQRSVVCDLLALVIPLATVHLCFLPIAGKKRTVPTILGWATIAYAAGQAIYFVERYGLHAEGSPAWSDIAWIGTYPLLMIGILAWPARYEPLGRNFRFVLDLLVAAVGLLAYSWVFLVAPYGESATNLGLKSFISVVYPICDILLVLCLFHMLRRGSDPRFRAPARIFGLGLLAVVTIDMVYAYNMINLNGAGGTLFKMGWPISCTASNLAAFIFLLRMRDIPEEETAPEHLEEALAVQPWLSVLPYALIPAVLGLIIFVHTYKPAKQYEAATFFVATLMAVGLVIRQILTIKENAMLLTKLQGAYRELSAKSSEIRRANQDLKDALGRLATNNDDLAEANSQLAQLVTIDGMTGLENHRAFQQHLRLEVDAAKRHRHPLSLIMADVDFFKRYNDEFGHPAGDEVLRQIATTIVDEVGENAYPARYGGEEFAVVLPYLGGAEALLVAERICRSVATRLRIRRKITMSLGVATLEPSWTAETLVSEADRALYAAKGWGRNRAIAVSDLDRQRLSLDILNEGTTEYDPNEPMGLAAIVSAGLRNHPQALGIEPDSQLAGGLLGTLELKDVETRDHSERVMWYAMRLAQSVIDSGISTMTHQELRSLAYGALLHDIGKIGVPENILKHPGDLDIEMKAVIREHPRLGAQIVQRFPSLDMALAVIRNHHERWDGRGYPSGLRGTDIPLVARIFSVVDGLEAMLSARPYSGPMPIEDVTKQLTLGSGTIYDPAMLRAFQLVPPEEWVKIADRESTLTRNVPISSVSG